MFCTQSDISARYPSQNLVELSSDGSKVDTAVINKAIEDATAEIEAHLGKYSLPDETPEIIVKLCVELSLLNLYARRSIFTDDLKEKRKWCDKLLNQLSLKEIELPEADTEVFSTCRIVSNTPRGW